MAGLLRCNENRLIEMGLWLLGELLYSVIGQIGPGRGSWLLDWGWER